MEGVRGVLESTDTRPGGVAGWDFELGDMGTNRPGAGESLRECEGYVSKGESGGGGLDRGCTEDVQTEGRDAAENGGAGNEDAGQAGSAGTQGVALCAETGRAAVRVVYLALLHIRKAWSHCPSFKAASQIGAMTNAQSACSSVGMDFRSILISYHVLAESHERLRFSLS